MKIKAKVREAIEEVVKALENESDRLHQELDMVEMDLVILKRRLEEGERG